MEIRKHYKISRVFKKNSKYWDWEDILVGKVLRTKVWAPSTHVNAEWAERLTCNPNLGGSSWGRLAG